MPARFRHDKIPIHHDGCGVLGILAKSHAPPIRSDETLTAIECARFRGSKFGAGFTGFKIDAFPEKYVTLRTFVLNNEAYAEARKTLESFAPEGLQIVHETPPDFASASTMATWEAYVLADDEILFNAAMEINARLEADGVFRARVYSSAKHHVTFKGVGYPSDVAEEYGMLDPALSARMWIAHTRQPTNSPGAYPIWSHPFSLMEWSIVHNGDVSSFGGNIPFMRSAGVESVVGNDSELICCLIDYLTRVEQLSLPEAALTLTSPYERWWKRIEADEGIDEQRLQQLAMNYVGSHLDGPFAVVAGHADDEDVHMLGIIDRLKFRPFVVGEDEDRIYLASEECEIRVLSPNAAVWGCDPGRYVLASGKEGFIERGLAPNRVMFEFTNLKRPADESKPDAVIDATGMEYETLNREIRKVSEDGAKNIHILRVRGQRYLAVNLPPETHLTLHGAPGNCLANFNEGAHISVWGNAADDTADTMHDGSITIHGSARDVLGQALQGGRIYVRGDIGNRAGILMRQYVDRRPVIMAGGRAGNYLGEYMSGGTIAVLGLAELECGSDAQIVGDFVAPGMLGGRIYIRGKVDRGCVGYVPNRVDVESYLETLQIDGLIADGALRQIMALPALTLDLMEPLLEEEAILRVRRLYDSKYRMPLIVREAPLDEEDLEVLAPHIDRFFETFGLEEALKAKLLDAVFTRVLAAPRMALETDPPPVIEE